MLQECSYKFLGVVVNSTFRKKPEAAICRFNVIVVLFNKIKSYEIGLSFSKGGWKYKNETRRTYAAFSKTEIY